MTTRDHEHPIKFQIVSPNFPIPEDGILGKPYLTKYKAIIHLYSQILKVDHVEKSKIQKTSEHNKTYAVPLLFSKKTRL